MKRRINKNKHKSPVHRTLTGKKVTIKAHSRRTRGGKRVVVHSYERGVRRAGQPVSSKTSSGSEYERLREKTTPYGELITKRLHTFQGDVEDALFGFKKTLGDTMTTAARKLKEANERRKNKPKGELNAVEKKLDSWLKKHGYEYKKYI